MVKNSPTEAHDTAAFQTRLKAALARSKNVPPHGLGQQTVLSKSLGVSQEAVRNWLLGKARPRPNLMSGLAELLEVDPGWLAMGLNPTGTPEAKAALEQALDGATYYVFGMLSMLGLRPAFSDLEGTDIVIMRGNRLEYIAVVPAVADGKGSCTAEIPPVVSDKATLIIPMADPARGRIPVVKIPVSEARGLAVDAKGYSVLHMDVSRPAGKYVFTAKGISIDSSELLTDLL